MQRRVSACSFMSCAGTEADIEPRLAGFAETKASALVVGADAFYNANAKLLAEAALRNKVPTS
jgi:hypothetical protein